MDELHFLRPWWLVGAAMCAVMVFVAHQRAAARSPWRKVIEPKLASVLIRRRAGSATWGASEILWLMLAIGMLAQAGPSWEKQFPDGIQDQAAVMIVLRNGDSMYAGDVAPNRNRAAKEKISELRELMPQSTFAVIAYADTAHIVIPPTRDDGFFALFMPPLAPDIMPRRSSNRSGLGQALDLARQTSGTVPWPFNVVVMTDSLSDQERLDLIQFHEKHPALEVVVVGTANGGELRFAPAGVAGRASGVPLADFTQLKEGGLPVTTLASDSRDVAWLVRNIRESLVQAHNADAQWHWKDSGYWLVFAMLPLGLLLYRRINAMSVAGPVVLFLATSYAPDAHAGWRDWWWTPDQQGQRAQDRGDYQRAADLYADNYRKGRAYYMAGNYAAATSALRQVHTAEGYFYLANSLAQQQQYQAALKYYEKASQVDPNLVQAKTNARNIQAALNALAKRPGERQKADTDSNDYTSLRIDLSRTRDNNSSGPATPQTMGEDELRHWMSNVQTSPKEMLKTLFMLQAQNREVEEPR